MPIDDDKTIIISSAENREVETHVINMDIGSEIIPKDKSSLSRKKYEIPFVVSQHNQPFLYILRALYREIISLENRPNHKDISLVKSKLIGIMDSHTKKLSELGYENTHIMIVRYILSTFVDEMLGGINWSGRESWANHSLLGHYYKETYGGKKFFQLLDQFTKEPTKYIQHMKLIYSCLSLGYKGQYSMSEHGDLQLENVRQELFKRIDQFDESKEKFYQNHPASSIKNKLSIQVPYKMFIISGVIILAIVYGIFTSAIKQNEEDLIKSLKKNVSLNIRGEN